jgi:imidazolonepropionase-like amidohydrolase
MEERGNTGPTASILLEHGVLIDGTGAAPVANARIVIADERILRVERGDEGGDEPADVQRIDVAGKTILPGLIDMHVHSTFQVQRDTRRQVAELLHDPDHLLFSRAVVNMQQALRAGVTTVRDCGGRGAIPMWVRDAIAQRMFVGPRLVVSGQPITTTAGHLCFLGQTADGIPEIVQAVRRQVQAGADFIKVCATGGAMTPGSNRGRAQYSITELTALVEDAHRLNKPVAAHCLCAEGMHNTVAAGCDTIEHCYWYNSHEVEQPLDLRVAQELVARGLFVSPVIGAGDHGGYLAEQCPVPVHEHWRQAASTGEDHYDFLRRQYGWFIRTPASQDHFANLRALRDLGARFVVGSDAGAGITRFQDFWLCLAVFVESLGFSVVEAIQAATQTAAQAMRLDAELGTIEAGKRADLVVVRGNPITNGLPCLQQVDLVIQAGRIVVKDGALVDPTPL